MKNLGTTKEIKKTRTIDEKNDESRERGHKKKKVKKTYTYLSNNLKYSISLENRSRQSSNTNQGESINRLSKSPNLCITQTRAILFG